MNAKDERLKTGKRSLVILAVDEGRENEVRFMTFVENCDEIRINNQYHLVMFIVVVNTVNKRSNKSEDL